MVESNGELRVAIAMMAKRMGSLSCPAPRWNPGGVYRVGVGENGAPEVQMFTQSGTWIRASLDEASFQGAFVKMVLELVGSLPTCECGKTVDASDWTAGLTAEKRVGAKCRHCDRVYSLRVQFG